MSAIREGGAGKGPPVRGRGEGLVVMARGSVMAFKAVADETDGDFSLMERTLPVGGRRPLPHRAYQLLGGVLHTRGHRHGRAGGSHCGCRPR